MKSTLLSLDELSRRRFAGYLAKSFLGVSLASWVWNAGVSRGFGSQGAGATASPSGGGRAKRVIYLYLNGGMSHLDTFDTKPGSEVQGPIETIATNVDGIRVSELLPKMAGHMKDVAVVRSLTSTQGAHERGRYFMKTGYTQRGTIRHPGMGAWLLRLGGKLNSTLPGNVRIGGDSTHPGAGFLEAQYAPLPLGNPTAGLQNSQYPRGVSDRVFERRLSLSERLDQVFRARYDQKQVRAYSYAYEDAIRLMKSEDLAAFDLSQESESVRGAYGEDAFGQGCLLARRLVEKDVRFVEVSYGGWDTHQNNFERLPDRCAVLDQAMSTLLADLRERGLLNETLVVLATEFGRTPKVNQNAGRDHYPKAFTCLLAGGGVRGGQVYGATDDQGAEVIEKPVSVPDFNATIAHAAGLAQEEIVMSPSGRPFTVASKGKPVTALF